MESSVAHPETQVQPMAAAEGPDSDNLNWSNIEPGLKYGVKAGLVPLDSLSDHIQSLFNDNL